MNKPNHYFVWDKVVRLTHWGVAVAVLLNLFVLEPGETVHEYLGYTAAGLIIIRLIWGLTLAQQEARLSALKPSLSGIKQHLHELKTRQQTHNGHNSLGSLSVIALWLLVLSAALSGFISNTDWGIDNDIDDVHEIIVNILLYMIYLHIIAVIITSLIVRRNLLRSMTVGRLKK